MSWFVLKSVLVAVLFPLVCSKVAAYDDNAYFNNLYRGEDDALNNTFEEDLELIQNDINTVGLNVENLAFDLFKQFMKFFNTEGDNHEQKSPKKVTDSPILVSQINLSEIRKIEDANDKLPINTIMKKISSIENLSPKSSNLKHSRNHTIKVRSADVSWKNLPIFSKGYQNYSSVLNDLEANVSQNNTDENSKIDDMNEKIFGYVRFLGDLLKNLHNLDSGEMIENIRDGTANLFSKVPASLERKLVEEFKQIQKDKKLLMLSKILMEQKQAETVENYDNNEHDLLDEVKQLLFSFFDETLKKSLAITKPVRKEKNINTSETSSLSNTNVKEIPEESVSADSLNKIFHSFENNNIRQKRQADLNKNWKSSHSSTQYNGRNYTAASDSVTIPEKIHYDETNRSEIRTGHTEIKGSSHDAEKKCLLYKNGQNIDDSSTEVLKKECQKLYSSLGKRKEPLQNQIDGNEIADVRHDNKISKDLAEKSNSSNGNMAIESSDLGMLIMKDFGSIKEQIESAERVLNETKKVLEKETFKEDHLQVEINNQKIEMRLLKSMLQVLLEKYFKGPNDQGLYSKTASQKPTETYNINSNSVPKLNSLKSRSSNTNENKVKFAKSDWNDRNTPENLESTTSLRNTNDDKKYNSDDKDVLEELVAFSKRFGDEREEKNIDEQFNKIKLKLSELRNQDINKNNNKFDMSQLTKSLENVAQPTSKSNDDILNELNNLQNAIDKLKPKDNNRFEHDNEGLKMFLEKLITTNQANRETPNGNFVHSFPSELYKKGYSPNYFPSNYPVEYETVNSNIDDNQYLCTVNIEPATKLWMTYNNVKPNCLEKPFQTTETKFENAKPYQRNVAPSTQYFRKSNIPADRIKGSSSSGGYSGHSNLDLPHRRIKSDPTVLSNRNLVLSDKPKITELPSTNTYAIENANAVPSTPMKKYEETPPLTDRDQIQHSTGIKYIPETNFREEIVKLKEEIKNLQSAIDTLNLLGTQDAATLHNLRVEINDLNRMINSLDENDPYVIRQEPTNLPPQTPPSWPTSVMNQPNYDGKAKQIKKREAPLSNEHYPIATSPVDQQNARAALGDNIQDIKNKVKELKSKIDPTTEQSGDSTARSSSSDDGHLYPLQYSQTNPISATYLLDPKSATGIKDDWFVGIVSKIMDKIIIALPVIFKKLLEFVFGQFTGLAYNDGYGNGYGNGYSTDVQNIINDLGIFGVLPLIALKAFQGLASIINLLRKNKFLKNFLIPAIIIGIVAASLIFLIWWLQPDDTDSMNNAISDVSNFANSNSENNNYGTANNDYVNNHGEYKTYRTNDDKNDFGRYNNSNILFKTLTTS